MAEFASICIRICEYSFDSTTTIEAQARAVRAAKINVACATDHDTIDGALRLRERADGFRVVVGEEIGTRDGELIGLFLERAVPPGLSAEGTIGLVDCIEVFDAREASPDGARQAQEFAREKNIPGAVGSDAHRESDVSRTHALAGYDRLGKWLARRRT